MLIYLIGKTWVSERAQQLNQEEKFNHDCDFTIGWVTRMMERQGMTLRAVQNTRKEGVEQAISKVNILFILFFIYII
jgi:hypothetical protein